MADPPELFQAFFIRHNLKLRKHQLAIDAKTPLAGYAIQIWVMQLQLIQLRDVIRRYKVVIVHGAVMVIGVPDHHNPLLI